jgi:hypothetical protein
MPLDASTLAASLADVARNPGDTIPACASAWAQAIGGYASSVLPASTTVSTAQVTLESALAGAFASPAAAPLMEVAMLAFGATVGIGMLPAFVAVPPAVPVGFVTFFATQPPPSTHEEAGAQLAALIDTWMRTGTANTVIPTTPVPWS